jgi:hypothetical protein
MKTRLALIGTSLLFGLGTLAHAQSQTGAQTDAQTDSQTRTTYRSDGVVAPQVRVEVPREKPRKVRVTRSRDAMAPKGAYLDRIEPVGGGVRTAPAGPESDASAKHVLVKVERKSPGPITPAPRRRPR